MNNVNFLNLNNMKILQQMAQVCLFVAVLASLPIIAIAQNKRIPADKVQKVSDFENLYESGDFYFAGQPTLEALKYVKNQGVVTVINLRSNDENKKFAKQAFNEEAVINEMGLKYISIPMKGKPSYSPKTLQQFSEALSTSEGKILVHCKGAGRVTYLMMAHLIKHHNYTMTEAVEFGNQITYFSALDNLLGVE
ncbi:MAG: hypothetical protein GY793_00690 [Proteobacteria bacterium]|nr:hypothetical protein [Pseudomonadota bacterium]